MKLFLNSENIIGNYYHFYVIRYLSMELNKKYSYNLSAFVSFLFDYSYELAEALPQAKYFFEDPKTFPESMNLSDTYLGLYGAYFMDPPKKIQEVFNISDSSIPDFLGFLGHKVIRK